jgi:hypothetical protein
MKKRLMIGFSIFLLILFLGVVSAYPSFSYSSVEDLTSRVIDFMSSIFSIFVGGEGDYLFERILLFIVVFCIINVVLNKVQIFKGKTGVIAVLSLTVSLLSTRFLSDYLIVLNIIVPYNVLGIVLTAVLPLIIFFVFVMSFESNVLRKVLWIMFMIIFIGVWYSRYDSLGELSWIYFFTGVIALIFLFADGTIRRYILKEQMKQLGINSRQDFEREILRQIRQADDDLAHSIITLAQHSNIKHRLQKQLKELRKN